LKAHNAAKTVSGHQVDQAFLFLASGFDTLKVGRKLALGRHERDHLGAQVEAIVNVNGLIRRGVGEKIYRDAFSRPRGGLSDLDIL